MTEEKIIRHAKGYMERLSQGINPLDGGSYSADSDMNNERLRRCFKCVAQILGEVLEAKIKPRPDIRLTSEQIDNIEVTIEPVPVSVIVNRINSVAGTKLKAVELNDLLAKRGYLKNATNADGSCSRTVTRSGESCGILALDAVSQTGRPYRRIQFNRDMQKYIINNISDWANNDSCDAIRQQKPVLDAVGEMLNGSFQRSDEVE